MHSLHTGRLLRPHMLECQTRMLPMVGGASALQASIWRVLTWQVYDPPLMNIPGLL